MDTQDIKAKALQLVQKNNSLLEEKKYYEFAQKFKLLGHRKFQSKKFDEAAALFQVGADALYSLQQVQKNIPLELLDQLAQIYAANPFLLTKQGEQQLLTILHKRPLTQRQLKLIHTIIVKTGKPVEHQVLSTFFLDFNVQNNNFACVQRLASNLSLDRSWSFVQKWSQSKDIEKGEIPALWSRMVLYRGIQHGANDAEEMFKNVRQLYPGDDPFIVFTGFLLKAVSIKSKDAFFTIERTYNQFLEADPIFSALFEAYGKKFFGIEKKNEGLLSLMK